MLAASSTYPTGILAAGLEDGHWFAFHPVGDDLDGTLSGAGVR